MNHNNKLLINKIIYRQKLLILDTNKGKFFALRKNLVNKKIYNYLNTHSFTNFLEPLTTYNNYILFKYIQSDNQDISKKVTELIYIISILHTKTTTYEPINLSKISDIYNNNLNELNYLDNYYHDLQDYIENKVYMSPAEYLLIRNISIIYRAINFSKETLKNWYEAIKNIKNIRVVLIHNNLKLSNFIYNEKKSYLINWNSSRRDLVVYDFLNFFKNNYQSLKINKYYEMYQNKFQYTKEEKILFFALLSKPWPLKITKNNYLNTLLVKELLDYLISGSLLFLEENKTNQETQE